MDTNNQNSDNREQDEMKEEMTVHPNRDVSGNDRTEERKEDDKHHQQFGNRRHKLFRNETSHNNQPMTDTGPGTAPNH